MAARATVVKMMEACMIAGRYYVRVFGVMSAGEYCVGVFQVVSLSWGSVRVESC